MYIYIYRDIHLVSSKMCIHVNPLGIIVWECLGAMRCGRHQRKRSWNTASNTVSRWQAPEATSTTRHFGYVHVFGCICMCWVMCLDMFFWFLLMFMETLWNSCTPMHLYEKLEAKLKWSQNHRARLQRWLWKGKSFQTLSLLHRDQDKIGLKICTMVTHAGPFCKELFQVINRRFW